MYSMIAPAYAKKYDVMKVSPRRAVAHRLEEPLPTALVTRVRSSSAK